MAETLLHGRWRLGAKIGAGGQGHTYVAHDTQARGERVVVVKEFRLRDAGWKRFDLFEREARVLRQLDYEGIPKVLDEFEGDAGTFYLVMEKAPGATLKAIATRARFTEAELRDVAARVLELLRYLHGRRPPVIHRDIKPANVLRAADGTVSLVDFGGVRAALREDGGGSTVVGTFGYMAPEQLHGAALPATDLYGLGATLVALAGGVEPEDVPRRGLRMDLRRHLAGLSDGFIAILERLTEPDPDSRPRSADEALELLRGSGALAVASAPPGPPAPSAPEDDELYLGDDLPAPLRFALRITLFSVSISGYVTLTVAQKVLVPMVFALVYAFTKPARRPGIKGVETTFRDTLTEGRRGFLDLQRRVLRRGRRRRDALPEPPDRRRLPPRGRS